MRMQSVRLFSALVLPFAAAASLAGCPDREVGSVDPQQVGSEGRSVAAGANRQLDLLFVIDNSNSMKEEQDSLARNFGNFINVLRTLPGGLPDLHLAVVTSDLGNNGATQTIQNCVGSGQNGDFQTGGVQFTGGVRFLSDQRDPNQPATGTARIKNYAADLADTFATMANVGVSGCGFEQHLGATRRALIGNQLNNGFLRKNALLAIVYIADEDDCSAANPSLFGNGAELGKLDNFRCTDQGVSCGPGAGQNLRIPGVYNDCRPRENTPHMLNVERLVADIRGLKAFPDDQILVAGIFGPTTPFAIGKRGEDADLTPSCEYAKPNCVVGPNETCKQTAKPSIRLSAFVEKFPLHRESTICKEDLSESLQDLAKIVKVGLSKQCFKSKLSTPISCVVTDILNPGDTDQASDLLPQCDATQTVKPCWRIEDNTTECPISDGFSGKRIVVERGNAPAVENIVTTFECETVSE
jgi:hypothetical protein